MITKQLVDNLLETSYDQFSDNLILHAKKSILNWMGVAIGAANHESVNMLLELAEELNNPGQISILGRKEKTDLLFASLINGMSSHIFDYDDTHLDTIHHPSGPVAPVVIALGEKLNLSGKEILKAFILGCETELRISNAVCPSHYDKGWHVTSTAGVFGAAVAAGILLNLNHIQMTYALGVAGTQAFGLREVFGTMTKPFHPGKAAQNGLLAALLAKKGFTSSQQIIEAKRGFANVLAPESNLNEIIDGWGERWELEKNSFKPYACGIVLHPAIDACIGLRDRAKLEDVKEIEIHVNPYVLELTGKKEPKTGLEGKFSVYHSGAIAFIDGDGGQRQYEDDKVLQASTLELRRKIKPVVKEHFREDEALAILRLNNGEEYTNYIKHATGSIENPMSEEVLQRKFNNVTSQIISKEQASVLIEQVMKLDELESLATILSNCTKA